MGISQISPDDIPLPSKKINNLNNFNALTDEIVDNKSSRYLDNLFTKQHSVYELNKGSKIPKENGLIV